MSIKKKITVEGAVGGPKENVQHIIMDQEALPGSCHQGRDLANV